MSSHLQRSWSTRLLRGLAALAVLALLPAAPAEPSPKASPPRITQVAVKATAGEARLSVTASGPLVYRTIQLSTPPRLVIDFPGAVLDAGVPPMLKVEGGGIARVRIGQFQNRPPIVRVAVDTTAVLPVTVATSRPNVFVARFNARRGAAVAPVTPLPAPASVIPVVPVKGAVAPAAAPKAPTQASQSTPAAPVAKASPPATATVAQASPAPAAPVAQASPAPAAPVAQATPGPVVPVAQASPGPVVPVAQATPAPPPARINLEFRNTELADVLTALAKVCNYNIVTDATVKGLITVRLLDVTCQEALRFILDANNLGFRPIGRNLIIMSADKLAPPPEVPQTISYPIGFGSAKDVADAVRAAVPGIRVAFDARSNTVLVVGTLAQHEEARRIMAALDVHLAQVMIEARVVDISMQDLRSLGFNWGLTGVDVITVQGTFPNQIAVGIATSTILGRLDALVTDRKARVISAPRVAVIDGNEAKVNLGEEVPIPSTDAAGRVTYTFKPVGVILTVLPKLNRDGSITTRVQPEITAVIEFLPTAAGPIPRLSSRMATSTMTIRSGESIVLAGLISISERRTVIKVPVLGDIPIIGSLFRTTTTDRQETEVIFVITPQILPGPGAPAPSPTPTPRP